MLLYGNETWALTLAKQDLFHQHCVCCILCISRTVHWKKCLTTAELSDQFGMVESIGDLLTQYRLRWLGHVA